MTVRSVGSVVLTVVLVLASWASGISSQTAQEPAESSDWPPGTLDRGGPRNSDRLLRWIPTSEWRDRNHAETEKTPR